jgi:hypothetical protein
MNLATRLVVVCSLTGWAAVASAQSPSDLIDATK